MYMQTCSSVNHVVLNDKVKLLLNESTVKRCENLEIKINFLNFYLFSIKKNTFYVSVT